MIRIVRKPAFIPEEVAESTRQRIIESAAEVFAEQGFRHATIRQIVDKAGANIAAVNYHFGGKAQLYADVFQGAMRHGITEYPIDLDLPPNPTAEQRLQAFVRSFFLRAFTGTGAGAHLGRMILREMVEPTAELNRRVNETMKPMSNHLKQIVQAIMDRPVSDDELFLACTSVISQIVFHKHCREVIVRMFPGRKYDRAELEELAAHVTRFSIAGLKSMKPGKERS